jgi:hypothetical protein
MREICKRNIEAGATALKKLSRISLGTGAKAGQHHSRVTGVLITQRTGEHRDFTGNGFFGRFFKSAIGYSDTKKQPLMPYPNSV